VGRVAVEPTDARPARICYLLRRVHQHLYLAATALLPDERHPRDIALLSVVAANAPVSQQWLADYLSINRSVMVKLIDSLEASGDVVRDRRADDRRSYALRTTAAGRRTIKQLAGVVDEAEEIVTRGLSTAERGRLIALLQAVVLPHFDPAPPEELRRLFGFLVAQANLRLEAASDARLAPSRLSVRTVVALGLLARNAPCSQQELATLLEIGPAATVELVDELERPGLVRRARNPEDRRSYSLSLTPAGEAALAGGRRILGETATEFTSALEDSDRRELERLLSTLAGVEAAAGPAA